MKKLLVVVTSLMIVACLTTGCIDGVKANMNTDDRIITGTDQEFVIAVDSNPTTGYMWEASYDHSILDLVEEGYDADQEPGLVGAGGTQYFRFKALEKGDTKITLTYKRSWETDYAEQQVFNVSIR